MATPDDQFSPNFDALDESRVPFSPFAVTPEPTDPVRFSPFPSPPAVDPVAGDLPEPVELIGDVEEPADTVDVVDRKTERTSISPERKTEPDSFPVSVPEDTLATDVRGDSMAYQQLGRSRSAMTSQIANLDAQLAVTVDTAKRKALEAKRAELGQSLTTIAAAQKEAGARAQAGVTEAEENAAIVAADARLEQAETSARASQVVRADAQRKRDKLAVQEQEARGQVQADRDKYRALMNRGPKEAAIMSSMSAIATEVFSAALQNRVPDMAKANASSWKRNREAFADERTGAASLIKMSGDRVRDLAAQRDAILAEEAAQEAAVLEAAAERAALQIQRAITPMEKARASMVWKGTQELFEQAESKAVLARMEGLQRQEKHQLDMEYKRAQIGKLGAEAAKIGAEAAKAGRRGVGRRVQISVERQLRGLPPKDATRIRERGLREASGAFMGLAQGTPVLATDKADQKALNNKLAKTSTINGLLNRLTALRNKWGVEVKATNSEALQAAEGALTELKLILKGKGFAELGVLTGPDVELLDSITGGTPLGFYSNLTRWSEMRSRMEDEMNNDLMRKTNFSDLNKRFTMPATAELKPLTRKEAVTKYRRAYHPKSGTVLSADDRMQSFRAALSATERERDTKAGAWSQMHAEAVSYAGTGDQEIGPAGQRVRDRMQADWQKAVDAGDDEKAERIDKAIEEEAAFVHALRGLRTKLGRGVTEEEESGFQRRKEKWIEGGGLGGLGE